MLGSFASVLIYRLPQGLNKTFNLITPRSHCVLCKEKISVVNLIPLISYILLKGKCGNCNQRISVWYVVHEIFLALACLLLVYQFGINDIKTWLLIIIIMLLYIQAISDLNTLLLSNSISLVLILMGLVLNIYFNFYVHIYDVILGTTLGFLMLWVINMVYKLYKGVNGIDQGDFLMLSASGALLGASSLGTVLLCGSIISIGAYYFIRNKHGQYIPLGSGISFVSIIYLFVIILN